MGRWSAGRLVLARWFGSLRWYLREFTGEAEYDRYCDRHRRTHPLVPVMSRREFERQRTDRRDAHPGDRCC